MLSTSLTVLKRIKLCNLYIAGLCKGVCMLTLGVRASQNCDAHVLPRIADVAICRRASRRSIAIVLRNANAHARPNDGGHTYYGNRLS